MFPTASYTQLVDSEAPRLNLDFRAFRKGPKDVVDAYVGAVTAGEFLAGRGCEVGGGDGGGTIVLPKPVDDTHSALLTWPRA